MSQDDFFCETIHKIVSSGYLFTFKGGSYSFLVCRKGCKNDSARWIADTGTHPDDSSQSFTTSRCLHSCQLLGYLGKFVIHYCEHTCDSGAKAHRVGHSCLIELGFSKQWPRGTAGLNQKPIWSYRFVKNAEQFIDNLSNCPNTNKNYKTIKRRCFPTFWRLFSKSLIPS